jgi:hypothetical protein
MTHDAEKRWLWAAVVVLTIALSAGCAGMKTAGSGEMPQEQMQPAGAEELPQSTVEIEVEEPPPEVKPPEDLVHTVTYEGETLSIIAKWYTGDLNNWQDLAAANPDIDPNRIFIGNEIVIPEELLLTRDPMPQYFIREN